MKLGFTLFLYKKKTENKMYYAVQETKNNSYSTITKNNIWLINVFLFLIKPMFKKMMFPFV